MERAAFSEPVDVVILSRHPNGGGIVEIPLLPVAEIDGKFTAGGGGKVQVTHEVLHEIVANFGSFPGPVPIGVSPHDGDGDRGGFSLGFVNAVSVRGDALYGQLDLTPALFDQVAQGGWRGFSVEMAHDLKTATATLSGWALTGGIFTNRPATNINFRIAASGEVETSETATHLTRLTAKETEAMSDERIAALEADLLTEQETVKTLRATQDATKVDTTGLQTRLEEKGKDLATANLSLSEARAKLGASENELARVNSELAKSDEARKAAEIKLEAEQTRSLADDVTKLAKDAIDRGVSAVLFEGLDEDPVVWFRKRYANLEAMKQFVAALPTVKESAVKSGNQPDENAAPVSKETAARLSRAGLNPKYAGITDENQLLDLRAGESK